MKAIRLKLNSSRGASMMMALMFLLCALVLGAVALTAASVNAGRTERNREEQQLYYSLSSAAALIEADMKTADFTSSTTESSTQQWTVNEQGVGRFSEPLTLNSSSFTVGSDSKLLYELRNDITSFYSGAPAAGVETTKILPLSFSAGEDMPLVNGTLTLYKGGARNYTIVFHIYIGDGVNNAGEMTLSFAPMLDSNYDKTESTEGDIHTVTTTDSTTVTWNEPNVSEGGEA